MTPPNRRRLGVLVGIALLALALASPALADPLSDKKAEAERLERQLDAQGERVSVLAERYNQARLKVERIEASLSKASGDLARSEQRMSEARHRLAQSAVVAYVHGGSNSMLSQLTRIDENMVVRRQYLRITALDQREAIDDMKAAREDLTGVRAELEEQRKAAREALAGTEAAKRQAAEAEAAQLALLQKAEGEVAALVAADQARREAEAAARARAALAARPVAAPTTTPAAKAPAQILNIPIPLASGKGGIAVAEAQKQIGKPYVWGGSGPDSFDCSGLTAWAWRAAGVRLSHSAQSQYYETPRVPLDALQPGDLLFFGSSTSTIHHNSIYVGNGSMIEASRSGVPVRYASSSRRDLVGAGRPG